MKRKIWGPKISSKQRDYHTSGESDLPAARCHVDASPRHSDLLLLQFSAIRGDKRRSCVVHKAVNSGDPSRKRQPSGHRLYSFFSKIIK